MKKLLKTMTLLAVGLLMLQSMVPAAIAQDDAEARKARILSNLKLQFPQLEKASVTMGAITDSGIEGLQEGTFVVNGRQNQQFLVTSDDTKLYLIAGTPIDVSRSQADIDAELAKRRAEEMKQAAERATKIEESIEGLPVRGNPNGKVTIVEFSDFQCPYCTRGAATVEQIIEKYGDDVKFVFKHFPLDFHKWAKPAAIASHCAGQQKHDAFWTLHDKYFEHQKEITPENVIAKSKEYLASSGLDMGQWETCATDTDSEEYKAASALVDADMAFGQQMGVTGTPGFFVNGTFLNGAQPLAAFEPLIQAATAGDSAGQ